MTPKKRKGGMIGLPRIDFAQPDAAQGQSEIDARKSALEKELEQADKYMHRDVEDYVRLLLLGTKIMPAELPARIRENLVARERLRAELNAIQREG